MLCGLLRVSRASLACRVTSGLAREQSVSSGLGSRTPLTSRVTPTFGRAQRAGAASIHKPSRYLAEDGSHELTTKLDDVSEVKRVSSKRNAYSREEIELLAKLLAEGKTYREIVPQLPGRTLASIKFKGTNMRDWYWSQDDYDQLSRGISEGLSDREIQQKYFPSRTRKAIGQKKRRGITPRPNAWSDAEGQMLLKLREEGKSILQIHEALPQRSVRAIQKRVIEFLVQQKIKPRPPTYAYTAEDVEILKSMRADGLDNAQIASRLHRTTRSITAKLYTPGLRSNSTEPRMNTRWTKAEDEKLAPFLNKRLEITKLLGLLSNRSEAAIISRLAANRERLGIVLNSAHATWDPEVSEKLRSLVAESKANDGSPTWLEISKRMGRSVASVKTKWRIIWDADNRAKLAQHSKQSDG